LSCSINAFGGIFYWRGLPNHCIVAKPRQVIWKMKLLKDGKWDDEPSDELVKANLDGGISFIDQDSKRHNIPWTAARGVVA